MEQLCQFTLQRHEWQKLRVHTGSHWGWLPDHMPQQYRQRTHGHRVRGHVERMQLQPANEVASCLVRAIQRDDALHLLVIQAEVPQLAALHDVVHIAGAGDDQGPHLEDPPQHHLGHILVHSSGH